MIAHQSDMAQHVSMLFRSSNNRFSSGPQCILARFTNMLMRFKDQVDIDQVPRVLADPHAAQIDVWILKLEALDHLLHSLVGHSVPKRLSGDILAQGLVIRPSDTLQRVVAMKDTWSYIAQQVLQPALDRTRNVARRHTGLRADEELVPRVRVTPSVLQETDAVWFADGLEC